jgi:hypothetical protein
MASVIMVVCHLHALHVLLVAHIVKAVDDGIAGRNVTCAGMAATLTASQLCAANRAPWFLAIIPSQTACRSTAMGAISCEAMPSLTDMHCVTSDLIQQCLPTASRCELFALRDATCMHT